MNLLIRKSHYNHFYMFPVGGDEAMQHIRSKDTKSVHPPHAGMRQILSVLPDTFPEYGDGDRDITCGIENLYHSKKIFAPHVQKLLPKIDHI